MRWRAITTAVLVWLACSVTTASRPAAAAEVPEWLERISLSGYAFGDAFYFVSDERDEVEGQSGFWFRRIYLTVDSELSDSLSARLRLEMNSPGDFSDSNNLEPYVKAAYLLWENGGRDLYLGISPTPTFDLIDQTWGYRQVEKSPVDLQRLGPSADFGVALKGALGEGELFTYHAMFANGSGTRGEVDSGKKGMLAAAFHPGDRWIVELYGDVESRPDNTDRHTAQIFGVYQGEQARFGVQVVRQHQEIASGGGRDLDIASTFGVFDLTEKASLLLRYDRMFDPNPEGPRIPYLPFLATAASQLVIVGVDLTLHQKFNLIPNVEAVFYDEVDGERPRETLVPRLTFFWRL